MADAETKGSSDGTGSRRNTKDYMELELGAVTDKDKPAQEGDEKEKVDMSLEGQRRANKEKVLWPCFMRDHADYLFDGVPFDLQREDNWLFVYSRNNTGFRVFNTALDRLAPVLKADVEFLSVSMNSSGKFVVCLTGNEKTPENFSIQLYAIPQGDEEEEVNEASPVYELQKTDIASDIPAGATANLRWETEDAFYVYLSDEADKYASMWVYQAYEVEPYAKLVVKCPKAWVTGAFWPDGLCSKMTHQEGGYRRSENSHKCKEFILALPAGAGSWLCYAVQEGFRPLGTLCPFQNERPVSSTWEADKASSDRYAAFFYTDDNESNREVVVYDFGAEPTHATMTEIFRAPMFPGTSWDDLRCEFAPSNGTTLLELFSQTEGEEAYVVYNIGEQKAAASSGQRKYSQAEMKQSVETAQVARVELPIPEYMEEGVGHYGKFGAVPDDAENLDPALLGTLYERLPTKYRLVPLQDNTLTVFDLENGCRPVISGYNPFEGKPFEWHFSQRGAILSTRPTAPEEERRPAPLLLFPKAQALDDAYDEYKVIDLAQEGKVILEEKLQFHKAVLSPQHEYVVAHHQLDFTIKHINGATNVTSDFQFVELGAADVTFAISPDDCYIAIAALHVLRVISMSHGNLHTPSIAVDYEVCENLSFEVAGPEINPMPPTKSEWSYVKFNDGGAVYVEQEYSKFRLLPKLDESQTKTLFVNSQLMLAIEPPEEDGHAAANGSMEVRRVDLGLKKCMDLSTRNCDVQLMQYMTCGKYDKEPVASQCVLISNATTLHVLDFGLAEQLVESRDELEKEKVTSVVESIDEKYTAFILMSVSDWWASSDEQVKVQSIIVARATRGGLEYLPTPEGTLKFSPFGTSSEKKQAIKFTAFFVPASSPQFLMLLSTTGTIMFYKLGKTSLEPCQGCLSYALPSPYESEPEEICGSWIQIPLKSGLQLINYESVEDGSYDPRAHYVSFKRASSNTLTHISENLALLGRDKDASLSVYRLGDNPTEIFYLNRVCDVENKFGGPEVSTHTTPNGRFLLVRNKYTFSADTCFVLIYDLSTATTPEKQKPPILKRNYGQLAGTNFNAFFPDGCNTHVVICTPGGRSVEVYNLLDAVAKGTKGELEPALKLDLTSATDSYMCQDLVAWVDEDKKESEKKIELPKKEHEEKKDDYAASSSSIFWIMQKSTCDVGFYLIENKPNTKPRLLRTLSKPAGSSAPEIESQYWPFLYVNSPGDRHALLVKVVMENGKISMPVTYDYTVDSSSAIRDRNMMASADATHTHILYTINEDEIVLHNLDQRSILTKISGDARKAAITSTPDKKGAVFYTLGSSSIYLYQFAYNSKQSLLPRDRKNEKLTEVSWQEGNLVVITNRSIFIYKFTESTSSLVLIGEIEPDNSWPVGSWTFELVLEGRLGALTRKDSSACLAFYRNLNMLEPNRVVTSPKWPLVDVLIDQKSDFRWTNGKFKYVTYDKAQYLYAYSPKREGLAIFDISRLAVDRYPIITWSSLKHVLKYDLSRFTDQLPNVARYLELYNSALVGIMSPKDQESALDHLVKAKLDDHNEKRTGNKMADRRYMALRLFLEQLPCQLDINPTISWKGQTILGYLIDKHSDQDYLSATVLLNFMVDGVKSGKVAPLADHSTFFASELALLAQHDPMQVANFLRDFGLQKLPANSPTVEDISRWLSYGLEMGNRKFITAGANTREPHDLWSSASLALGSERCEVCYVAIPGLCVPKQKLCSDQSTPFHDLVQVACDKQCAELLANPAMAAIVDFKWRSYARSRFQFAFTLHLLSTLSVILFCAFHPLQDSTASLTEVAATSAGRTCLAMLVIFSIYAIFNFVREMRELLIQGVKRYLGVWNTAANLQSALLLATALMYLMRHHNTRFLAGASVLLCHIYILFYLQALESTGPLVRMVLRISSDMKYFTGVLFLCLVACTFFYIVITNGTGIGEGNIFMVFLRMYQGFFFFDFDDSLIDSLATSDEITVAYIMQVAGTMFVAIVLLNLLIALMGDSFAVIKARDTIETQLLRASMVRDIEFNIRQPESSYPLWVHCLVPVREALETKEALFEHKLDAALGRLEARFDQLREQQSTINRRGSMDMTKRRSDETANNPK